jgi:hypothetical protein
MRRRDEKFATRIALTYVLQEKHRLQLYLTCSLFKKIKMSSVARSSLEDAAHLVLLIERNHESALLHWTFYIRS